MRSFRSEVGCALAVLIVLCLAVTCVLASADLDGDVDYTDLVGFVSCLNGPGQTPASGCTASADLDSDADVDLLDCSVLQATFTGKRVRALIPEKRYTFDLIAMHDPESDGFDGDCTGCHVDRVDEVALDGVTPTAHSRMLNALGRADWLCVACHRGVDFVNQSSGGLRQQVSLAENACVECHNQDSSPEIPHFFVRP